MFPLAPVGRGPSGCILPRVSLHFVSLCPGLGSSCPFGAFTSNRILMRMFFHDNKDNTIGALTANSIPVRNWKSVKKRRKKPWKSVNFLCFIPWKSVKKRRKKPWKSVICRSLCPVYKQNIAIYIITRTITDVHGRHGELLYDSCFASYMSVLRFIIFLLYGTIQVISRPCEILFLWILNN